MVIEHDPDNPCCLSCGKEQGSDQCNKMVQCDECESWFHASCVNLIDDGQQLDTTNPWFCPLCIHKETPLSHMTKLTQVSTIEIYIMNVFVTLIFLKRMPVLGSFGT